MPVRLTIPRPLDPLEDWVKDHWCSSFEVATKVASDLVSRFNETVQLEPEEPERAMHLDFGGTMMTRWKPEQTGSFSFWPHQLSMVIHNLQRALDNPRGDGDWIKLHGVYFCICLTVEEGKNILTYLKSPEMAAKEASAMEDWDKALGILSKSPHVLLPKPNPNIEVV